jgi:hypothetical protein
MSGQRPDFTLAQKIAAGVGGIPVLSNLLAAFGLWAPNAAQQDALSGAVTWGGVLAGLLIAGDAGIRGARNVSDARRDAATAMASSAMIANGAVGIPPAGAAAVDPETGLGELLAIEDPDVDDDDLDLPSDDEELTDPDAAKIAADLEADPDRPAS